MELEHEAYVAVTEGGEFALRESSGVGSVDEQLSAVGGVERAYNL